MSVSTMQAMARKSGKATKRNDKGALDTQLGAIAAYIPSEVLAAYTTALGVTATVTPADTMRWLLYAGTIVLLLIFVSLQYAIARKEAKLEQEQKPETELPSAAKQVWVFLMAVAAFTAYVMALPGSPFGGANVNIVGGLLVIVLALLLPLFGTLIGVTPDPKK